MELFRCILFLAVDVILSVQNLDTGGKLKHFFQLHSVFFFFFFVIRFFSSLSLFQACTSGDFT